MAMVKKKIDETVILADFNYEELYNSKSKHYANTNRRTHAWSCASSQVDLSDE